MQAYRAQFGGNVDERMLKQLGIDQRIVQQMIEEETGLAEASRLGITATDEEVQTRIATMPGLQENGQFIGEQRYRQLLQMQNPPMTPHDFEEQIRRGVTLQKLQAALTNWITVSDKELGDEYKRRNEKVKLAVVSFPADKFREGLQRDRRRTERVLRSAQERAEDPGEAEGQVRAGRHAGDSQSHAGLRAGHPAQLRGQPAAGPRRPNRCAPATSC